MFDCITTRFSPIRLLIRCHFRRYDAATLLLMLICHDDILTAAHDATLLLILFRCFLMLAFFQR